MAADRLPLKETVRARLHTIDTSPEEYEAGLALVRDELLPWARESSGFCGAIGLVDPETGKALFLTLWADDESLAAGAGAAERLSALAADATGARRRSIENFEVSLFDVPGSTA
jgi:hypothetical protein